MLAQLPESVERPLRLVKVDFEPEHRQPAAVLVLAATGAALAGSLIADAVLVKAGETMFPSTKGYPHFHFSDYAKLTVIGVIIACVAWPIVTRISSEPRWLFFRQAIAVTLVLFLPDLWIWYKGSPGDAVAVLMVMHVAIALVTYNALVHIARVQPDGSVPRRHAAHDGRRSRGYADDGEAYGYADYGQNDRGRDGYARQDYGQNDYGQNDYGQNDYGRQDYGRQDYGRGAYGAENYGPDDYGQNDYFPGDRRPEPPRRYPAQREQDPYQASYREPDSRRPAARYLDARYLEARYPGPDDRQQASYRQPDDRNQPRYQQPGGRAGAGSAEPDDPYEAYFRKPADPYEDRQR